MELQTWMRHEGMSVQPQKHLIMYSTSNSRGRVSLHSNRENWQDRNCSFRVPRDPTVGPKDEFQKLHAIGPTAPQLLSAPVNAVSEALLVSEANRTVEKTVHRGTNSSLAPSTGSVSR